ncbi:MAG: LacI family DNA-binding transcriptional regulator [Chloroflexota bacterium]|nr:LacI family DNA-binding transcriptional regulator [Chloroflexota bacterium]
MTTIRDVAKQAEVSPSTVSHVLNDTRFVSEPTRERVLAAIKELHYRPNILARSLRRQETRMLGIIIPDNANPFFAEIVHGVEDFIFDENYTLLLGNSDGNSEKELTYLDLFINKQVDGVVLVSSAAENRASIDLLAANAVPTVIVDREIEIDSSDTVLVDNLAGGYQMTNYLLELGHRRIGCITGPSQLTPSAQRVTGYQQALKEAGVLIDPQLIVAGDFHSASGYRAAQTLFALSERPTAIFACNDMMALGVLGAAHDAGLDVPREVAVAGFDNIELGELILPRLTTIAQPTYEMGNLAAELLVQRLREPERPSERRVLLVHLIERESTRPS